MVILTIALATAAEAQGPGRQRLTVYLENHSRAPLPVIAAARAASGDLFSAIGIDIEWRGSAPEPPPDGAYLVMTIVNHAPPDFGAGVLAAAYPFERVHIRLLYDRVLASAGLPVEPLRLAHTMAYVMAHEIGHMLQGVSRHSATGVMKAKLGQEDLLAMQLGKLRFEPSDIRLIHLGVAGRMGGQ
jgi:hypothetical protein